MYMKFILSDIQAVVFLSAVDLSNKVGLANEFIEKSERFFDGEPVIFPLPPDAPVEIPRIILRNRSNTYSLNIGVNRFDFFYNAPRESDQLPAGEINDVKEGFLNNLRMILVSIKDITAGKITRVGHNMTLLHQTDGTALELVREKYLKDGALIQEASEIQLSVLNKKSISEGLQSNLWLRTNTFHKPESELDNKLVVFKLDLNTVPEEPLNLSAEEAQKYFEDTFTYAQENLDSLFMNEG